MMPLPCLFCASPTAFKSGATVEEQLKVNFILRNILGMSNDKVNQLGGRLRGDGQLHPQLEVQVCLSCGEQVEEIVRLRNKTTRMSAALKDRIIETSEEVGEGNNSMWGQIRLDVLLKMDANAQGGDQLDLGNKSQFAESQSTTSGTSADNDDEDAEVTSLDSSTVSSARFVSDHLGVDESGTDGLANFRDPLMAVEEKVLGRPLDTEENENDNREEPVRRSTRTRALSKTSMLPMQLETSSEEDEEPESDHSVYGQRKQGSGTNLGYLLRQPDGLYHCPFCPKKYAKINSRNKHKQVHSQGYVCKLCNQRFSYSTALRVHMRDKRCPGLRGTKSKGSCKHCGKKFPNLGAHEKVCDKRKQRGSSPALKKHLK